jgi:hypothetical protein
MEPATVIGLVTALAETYSDGFDDYETWKARRTAENHYAGRGAATPVCALATSDFATGDGKQSSIAFTVPHGSLE